jgi:hypothetical protein
LASVDRLSGGCLEIGLGAGWNIDEYQISELECGPKPLLLKEKWLSLKPTSS